MFNKNILPVIFIGPCLPQKEIEKILKVKAIIMPPIRRGDLLKLPENIELVGIVDGVFFSNLSITPREILECIQKKVVVVGSSSMGAMRAAELDVYGMIGIGEIYRQYHEQEIESDAEVALTFNPETFQTLSEPLVNIRYATKRALEEHVIDQDQCNQIIECAQSIYFFDLNYNNLFHELRKAENSDFVLRFEQFVSENKNTLDLKRQDAIRLIQYINQQYE